MDHNSRIVISADASSLEKAKKQLIDLGIVEEKNFEKFKEHSAKTKAAHKEHIDMNTKLTHSLEELGEGMLTVFAAEKVLEFGAECVKAFGEAQKATNELKFAVLNLAGGNDSAFNELLEQSEILSTSLNNLFSPKQIQQSQTMLLRMKLNTEQVAQLMPRIADIAAKTGKDLNSVAEGFGRAISEGNTKALTEFGLKFKDTGTVVGNFNKVMESSVKYIGGAASAMDDFANQQKEAANKAEILQEKIGSQLTPIWVGLKNEVLGGTSALIDFFVELKNGLTGKNFDWKEASKDLANALGYLFTAGLVHFKTTAEQMAEYQKMSYNMLLKNYVGLKHELDAATAKGDAEEIHAIGEKLRIISGLVDKHNKKIIEENDTTDKDLRGNKDKADAMSISQLKAYQKQVLDHEHSFSSTGFEQEKAAIESAIKRAEEGGKKKIDAKRKQIDAKRKQLEKEEQMMKDFEKKAIEEMIKDDNERIKTSEEMSNLITKKEEQTNEAELESKKLALKKKFDAGKLTKEQYDEQTKSLERKNGVANAQIELDNLKDFQKEKRIFLENERTNNLISEEEYKKELLKLDVEQGDAEIKLQKAINQSTFDLKESDAKKTKELIEGIKEFTTIITESLQESIESSIQAIDTQAERQNKMIDYQKVLAEKGLANDLAFEERRADELMRKKQEQEKKLRKAKELETFLNSLAAFAEQNPNTAIAKALGVLAASKAVEAVYMEEGGIMGQTSQRSTIGLNQFGRRHRSGNDLLIHGERGEGVIPVKKMNEWGLTNNGMFSNFLRNPFTAIPIPQQQPVFINNNAELVSKLEAVEQAIKNIQIPDWHLNELNEWVTKEVRNGMTVYTTHKRKLI